MIGNSNISTIGHTECCGCKLCGDVCPKGCITFKEDAEGFFYPHIKEESCVNCGLCLKNCPESKVTLHPAPKVVFSAYARNKDLHQIGSSGGFFAVLAREVLKSGGKVYGAAFDDKIQLRHVGIDSIELLPPLCKSKYLQSDCSGIYSSVLNNLKEGSKVLFCGTPCQCQAIQNYIPEKFSKSLLVVDFACHGVSCQSLFDKNIKRYGKKIGNIVNYQFREKKKAKYHQSFSICYKKDSGYRAVKIGTYYEDPYYYGYEKRFILRESCYVCKWASSKRCSDLTMMDFFGIREAYPNIKEKYVSGVFCNTEKGRLILDKISVEFSDFKEFPRAMATKKNECLNHPMERPALRDKFFRSLRDKGFDYVAVTYLKPKCKLIYDLFYSIPDDIRIKIRKMIHLIIR